MALHRLQGSAEQTMISPLPVLIIALAFLGLGLNLASGGTPQPDWALALLLAALLSRRHAWPWVLPAILIHDLMLYWSVWGVFPMACLLPFSMASLDAQIGAGLPQRLTLLVLLTLPMLWQGAGVLQWLLTLILCVPVWHLLVHLYEQQYA